jgi:hypothetical protein
VNDEAEHAGLEACGAETRIQMVTIAVQCVCCKASPKKAGTALAMPTRNPLMELATPISKLRGTGATYISTYQSKYTAGVDAEPRELRS